VLIPVFIAAFIIIYIIVIIFATVADLAVGSSAIAAERC